MSFFDDYVADGLCCRSCGEYRAAANPASPAVWRGGCDAARNPRRTDRSAENRSPPLLARIPSKKLFSTLFRKST